MQSIQKLILIISVCSSLACLTSDALASTETSPKYDEKKLTQEIFALISKSQLSNNAIKKLGSDEILDKFLTTIDPNKLYFLADDITSIKKKYPLKTNAIKNGNLANAYTIYTLYQKAWQAENELCISQSSYDENSLHVTSGQTPAPTSSHWASSQAEREERWKASFAIKYLNEAEHAAPETNIRNMLRQRCLRNKMAFEKRQPEENYSDLINKLLSIYNDNTLYLLPPVNEKAINFDLVGIGVVVTQGEYYPVVKNTVPGSTSEGKLFPNDKILAISQDGKTYTDTSLLTLDEVVKLLRGEKGTSVHVKVLSSNDSSTIKDIDILRQIVKLESQSVSASTLTLTRNNKNFHLGILRIPGFYLDFSAFQRGISDYRSSTNDAKKSLIQLNESNIDGLIIDLRDNQGGPLVEAQNFFALFQHPGPVYFLQDASGKLSEEIAKAEQVAFKKPILLLVNNRSAGTAELFASAVKEHHRGLIAGETTNGMGVVSSVETLSYGMMKIPVATLYTATGSPINHHGIKPDISIHLSTEPPQEEPSTSNKGNLKVRRFTPLSNFNPDIKELQHKQDIRMNQTPSLVALLALKNELSQAETSSQTKTIDSQKINSEKANDLLAQFAKNAGIGNQDVRQYIANEELKESGEILVDAIEMAHWSSSQQ